MDTDEHGFYRSKLRKTERGRKIKAERFGWRGLTAGYAEENPKDKSRKSNHRWTRLNANFTGVNGGNREA